MAPILRRSEEPIAPATTFIASGTLQTKNMTPEKATSSLETINGPIFLVDASSVLVTKIA